MQPALNSDDDSFLRRIAKSGEFSDSVLGRESFIRTKDGTLYTFELPKVPDAADRWLDGNVCALNIQCKGRMFGFIEKIKSCEQAPTQTVPKPQDSIKSDVERRKRQPLASGVLDYFPAALRAVAECSLVGNEQHNPGQPLHHARDKSADHPDALLRHLADRGSIDTDGVRHSAKVAWRALAMLQEELEAAGEPKARAAVLSDRREK